MDYLIQIGKIKIMRKILLIIFIIPLLNYGQMIKKDKSQHIVAGVLISGFSYYGTRTAIAIFSPNLPEYKAERISKWTSIGLTLLAAGYQELRKGGNKDIEDFLHTAVTGTLISITLDKDSKSNKKHLF